MNELRGYQQEDLQFLLEHPTAGIFSEQRTGKTPVLCKLIETLKPRLNRGILIVCPASIVTVWRAELEKWAGLTSIIIDKTDFECSLLSTNDILIVNYEKLRKDSVWTQLYKWKPEMIIVDEAHRIKNRKSQQYKAVSKFKICTYRYLLTGTPCHNTPWDIWTLLNFLKPKMFSSYWEFMETYFRYRTMYYGGKSFKQPIGFKAGKDSYLQAILATFCVQRKRKDVMQWLTEADTPTRIMLKPSVSEGTAINELEKWFEYKHILAKNTLDCLIKIKQVALDPRVVGLKGKSTKTTWLTQYIKDYPEENILIFSNSRKYLELLQEDFGYPIICGSTKIEDRAKIAEKFQKEGGIVLCQIQACKEGITLDNADTSIFMDAYPPAADYLQAKDRMVATTEERNKPKKLIHVMLEGTYDATLFDLVERQISLTDTINNFKQYLEDRTNAKNP